MDGAVTRSTRLSRSPARNLRSSGGKRRRSSPRVITKKVETPKSAVNKLKKKKRRSSIKRRSLVAALECIQSNEVSSLATDKARDENIIEESDRGIDIDKKRVIINGEVQDTKSVKTNREDAESSAKLVNLVEESEKEVVAIISSSNLHIEAEKVLDISSTNLALSVSNKKNKILSKLVFECDQWVLQKKKYEELQNLANTELQSSMSNDKRVLSTDPKYDNYHLQITVLEDKFGNSLNAISDVMAKTESLREINSAKVYQITQEMFKDVFTEKEDNDPKQIIENIFIHTRYHTG